MLGFLCSKLLALQDPLLERFSYLQVLKFTAAVGFSRPFTCSLTFSFVTDLRLSGDTVLPSQYDTVEDGQQNMQKPIRKSVWTKPVGPGLG